MYELALEDLVRGTEENSRRDFLPVFGGIWQYYLPHRLTTPASIALSLVCVWLAHACLNGCCYY